MARILIVEDSDDVRQLLCVALADEGHAAHGVKTAAEGNWALERGNYELLIADMRLPDGSGADLAEKAKRRAVEALLTTGHPDEMHRLEQRGVDYLRKPFPLKDLAQLVDRRVAHGAPPRRKADHAALPGLAVSVSASRQAHRVVAKMTAPGTSRRGAAKQ